MKIDDAKNDASELTTHIDAVRNNKRYQCLKVEENFKKNGR